MRTVTKRRDVSSKSKRKRLALIKQRHQEIVRRRHAEFDSTLDFLADEDIPDADID